MEYVVVLVAVDHRRAQRGPHLLAIADIDQ
jgi:hypothetical protein